MAARASRRMLIIAVGLLLAGCGTTVGPSSEASPTSGNVALASPTDAASIGVEATPSDEQSASPEPSPTAGPTLTPKPVATPKPTPKPTPRPTRTPAPTWSINAQIDKTRYWNDPSTMIIYIAVSGTVPKDPTSAQYDLSCDMGLSLPSGQSLSNHFSGQGTNGYVGPTFGWNFYGAWGQSNVGTAHWTIDCYNTTGTPPDQHRSDSGSITVPIDPSPAP